MTLDPGAERSGITSDMRDGAIRQSSAIVGCTSFPAPTRAPVEIHEDVIRQGHSRSHRLGRAAVFCVMPELEAGLCGSMCLFQ